MKNILNKHKVKLIFIIILIFQVIAIIYAASQRVHLHMDEYLSFGFISSKDMYISAKEDFFNTWHTNDYFYEYLEINEDEVEDFTPVYENQKNDVHPPLYYLLLRTFNNFSIDNFTIWFAIALNVILFIISMCLVYLIGKKIFKNEKYTLLLCFIVGFNIGIIQMAIYIRMYQLLILCGLLLLYWHLCYGNKEKLEFKDCLKLSLIVVAGFLTHYYFIIFLATLYLVYFIQRIRDKKFKNLIKYTLSLILAVAIATVIFPYWINHMFSSGRGKEAYNFLLIRPLYLGTLLYEGFIVLAKRGFNYTLYAFLLIILIFMILTIYYKLKNKDKLPKDRNIVYVLYPTLLYFVIILFIIPYGEIRYFSIILVNIIILLLYYLKKFGEYVLKNEKSCFNIISIICLLTTFINLLNINDNLYTYKDNRNALENIDDTCSLIYVYGDKKGAWYDSYVVFLKYKNSIILEYNENIVEDISNVIKEKNLKSNEYVIGTDKAVYIDLREKLLSTPEYENLEFSYYIGRSGFLQNLC